MKFSSTRPLCFSGSSNILLHNSKSISSQTSCLCTCTCTVHRHRYSSHSILRYIFHIKPHFSIFFYCEVIPKRILIIFAPEEAEIFKDYFLFQHDFPLDCVDLYVIIPVHGIGSIKTTRGKITCYCPRKMLLPRRQITRRKLCFYYTCKFGIISIKYVIRCSKH